MMLICVVCFGCPRNISTKDKITAEEVGRLRRPTSLAVILSFVQMFPGRQIKKCRFASYLMEHFDFEAQLCTSSEISMFHGNPNLNPDYPAVNTPPAKRFWQDVLFCYAFGLFL